MGSRRRRRRRRIGSFAPTTISQYRRFRRRRRCWTCSSAAATTTHPRERTNETKKLQSDRPRPLLHLELKHFCLFDATMDGRQQLSPKSNAYSHHYWSTSPRNGENGLTAETGYSNGVFKHKNQLVWSTDVSSIRLVVRAIFPWSHLLVNGMVG